MTAFILVVLLALFVSAYCSLFEATLYSTRRGTLEAARLAGQRPTLAERFIRLKDDVSRPIAAILILNTIAHTAGATMAGVYGVEVLGQSLMPAFSIIFTAVILVFTEILPKTAGVVYWRSIWPYTVWPLTTMIYALYPLIWLTEKISRLIITSGDGKKITQEEIVAFIRLGQKDGEISREESLLLHNIIDLDNKAIKDIMTPRIVIFSLEASMTVEQAVQAVEGKGHTRIPIYEKERENITGYIIAPDLFAAKTLDKPNQPIKSLAKPISFVPESTNALSLLTRFLKSRRHIAIAVDEYGGVAGLVTLEDLIETLLGDEIVDETDQVVDLQERARQMRRQLPSS
ncbi:MAG: hemolysin family protein [Desulfomonilaceae bacterium]|nr:hemolysin family protein [Desulfomonilaceae bacterium]